LGAEAASDKFQKPRYLQAASSWRNLGTGASHPAVPKAHCEPARYLRYSDWTLPATKRLRCLRNGSDCSAKRLVGVRRGLAIHELGQGTKEKRYAVASGPFRKIHDLCCAVKAVCCLPNAGQMDQVRSGRRSSPGECYSPARTMCVCPKGLRRHCGSPPAAKEHVNLSSSDLRSTAASDPKRTLIFRVKPQELESRPVRVHMCVQKKSWPLHQLEDGAGIHTSVAALSET